MGEWKLDLREATTEELKRIYQLEREMEELPGIYSVHSLVDLVKDLYVLRLGRDAFPPARLVRTMLELIPEGRALYSDSGLLFFAVTQEWSTEATQIALQFDEENPELISMTGLPILFSRLNELVVDTQRSSLLITAAGVFILLLFLFRSLRTTLISIFPIVITVLGIYGLLYITGFHLSMLTETLSSIAIGVGIDYAIHLVFCIHYYQKRGEPDFAIKALYSTGVPILANALGIGAGIMVVIFSPLHYHFQVATIMGFAMAISSVSALAVIPAFYHRGAGFRSFFQSFRKKAPRRGTRGR
jgi:predicted RND superfamily exporter protein